MESLGSFASVPQNLGSSLDWIQFSKCIWSCLSAFIQPSWSQDNFPEYIHNKGVKFFNKPYIILSETALAFIV